MLGNPQQALAAAALAIAAGAGCDRGRADPVSTPPVSAVEVPAVPPDSDRTPAINRRSERTPPPDERENSGNVDEEGITLEDDDAGAVHQVSTASDAGVRFWGTFKALDGGFSFRGGFSMGTTSASDGGPGAPP
jgi:hypothetical protein